MQCRRFFPLLIALCAGAMASSAAAQPLALGAPFSDGMVIQRGQSIPVWGKAKPGALVKIALGDHSQEVSAGADSIWQTELPQQAAKMGLTLSIEEGITRLAIRDVAIGDVFLCSGQSNMAFSMEETFLPANERSLPIDRNIRLLAVPFGEAQVERDRFVNPASWKNAADGPGTFSAICMLAGRKLARQHDIVIGLIDSSRGGTPIEAWLPYEGLVGVPGMDEGVAILDAYRRDPLEAAARYAARLGKLWQAKPATATSAARSRLGFANLFNAMIAPLGPTRLAGTLWYQGEGNAIEPANYDLKLTRLLASWRQRAGSQVPFVIIQLANFGKLSGAADDNNWAQIREAQRRVVGDDPRAELVVTIDVGERLDIHPPLKKPVGLRAAAALERLVYGSADAYRPPAAVSARSAAGVVHISISGEPDKLFAASWGRPGPFMLCGDPGGINCQFADARFGGDGIMVEIPEGLEPTVVRYCWDAAPLCNVFDSTEMPLGPFQLKVLAE